jgi:hypothetical protein
MKTIIITTVLVLGIGFVVNATPVKHTLNPEAIQTHIAELKQRAASYNEKATSLKTQIDQRYAEGQEKALMNATEEQKAIYRNDPSLLRRIAPLYNSQLDEAEHLHNNATVIAREANKMASYLKNYDIYHDTVARMESDARQHPDNELYSERAHSALRELEHVNRHIVANHLHIQ